MKKFGLLVLLLTINIIAGPEQEQFLRAADLYDTGDCQQACTLFKELPRRQTYPYTSAQILYNIGNCEYQQGNYFDAIISWRSAQKITNSRTIFNDAHYNCMRAYQKLGYEGPQQTYVEWLYQYFLPLPFIVVQIIFILLWFLCIYLAFNLRYPRLRLYFFFCLLGLCLSSVVIGVRFFYQYRVIALSRIDNNDLYVGPNANYHTVGVLDKAQQVEVVETLGAWYKVKSSDVVGWGKADSMVDI